MTFDLTQLPHKLGNGGYVYAIAFDVGMVKVGSTCDPRTRIANHRHTGRGFRSEIQNIWVSASMRRHAQAERSLIVSAAHLSENGADAEYLLGAAFPDVVGVARSMGLLEEVNTAPDVRIPRQRTSRGALRSVRTAALDATMRRWGHHTVVEQAWAMGMDPGLYRRIHAGEPVVTDRIALYLVGALGIKPPSLFHAADASSSEPAVDFSLQQWSLFEAVTA